MPKSFNDDAGRDARGAAKRHPRGARTRRGNQQGHGDFPTARPPPGAQKMASSTFGSAQRG
eukprot:9533176-Lingulodinium_polyedra.AAC.1